MVIFRTQEIKEAGYTRLNFETENTNAGALESLQETGEQIPQDAKNRNKDCSQANEIKEIRNPRV
jgi:hypothetical protein